MSTVEAREGGTDPTSPSQRPGAVVLVSFRPPPELFRIQLESIRDQTRGDFRCFIAADGDEAETYGLVSDVVGSDDRFELIGFPDNVGVHLNVERVLAAVPPDVGWIAIADQDDRWYPGKLERLVPLLDRASLVLGQARVTSWPAGRVLRQRTSRRVVPVRELVLENQISGGLAVMRRDMLEIALPFPRLNSPSQYPDHWLGACAASLDGYLVVDEVLQDYVQHGQNLVGEALEKPRRHPLQSLHEIQRIADRYLGGHSPAQCAHAYNRMSFGWRRAMAESLVERVSDPPEGLIELAWQLRLSSGPIALAQLLRFAQSSPNVSGGTLEALVAGTPFELALRVRHTRRLWPGSRHTAGGRIRVDQ